MMPRPIALVALAFLVGCARATPVHFGNGLAGYVITCNDLSGTFDRCFRQAGEICGSYGYALYDWQGYPIGDARVIRPVVFGDELERTLLIACRA